MRELEFLPAWYPALRRKRRVLFLETWLAVVIFTGMGLWAILSARNVSGKETILNQRLGQLSQSNFELRKLGELESLKQQMSDQAKLVSRLGLNLPMGRLVGVMEQVMPSEMAWLDLTADLQQTMRAGSALATAAGAEPTVDRELSIQLHGVAPSDVELGNFMIKLATIPHFTSSSMSNADLRQNGHLMREFRISFSINLNDPEN
jgi:hypothetical protein